MSDKRHRDNLKGELGEYTPQETEDGSITFYSEYFQEAFHSHSGAASETRYNFLESLKLEELFEERSEVRILEIGYGSGMGARETLLLHENYADSCKLSFTSTELDPLLPLKTKEMIYWPNSLPQTAPHKLEEIDIYQGEVQGQNLQVLIGDAKETLARFRKIRPELKFDVIFQDAFCPKNNADLWTQSWFELLADLSHQTTALSTYSASISVRKALHHAGWGIYNHPGFGRKKSMTLAYRDKASCPELIKRLKL